MWCYKFLAYATYQPCFNRQKRFEIEILEIEDKVMEDMIIAGSVLLAGGIFVIGAICIDWYKSVKRRFGENEE